MRIEGVQFTIIGVMPPSFFGLKVGKISDVAIPLAAQESIAPMGPKLTNVDVLWINTIARLKAGISPVQASTNIETIWPQILETLVPAAIHPRAGQASCEIAYNLHQPREGSPTSGSDSLNHCSYYPV